MEQKKETLTYRHNMSKAEVYRVMKAVGLPIAVFGLGLYTISNFANFGTLIVCPLSGAMWFVAVVVAFFMPAQRNEILNQAMITCTGYYAGLYGLRILLGLISGASSEMISASYDQAIPMSTGNAIPGYVQTMIWFVAVLVPIGFIGMQGKRMLQFHHNQSLQKTFGQKRGIRNSGSDSTKTTY